MPEHPRDIEYLILRHLQQALSPDEEDELNRWLGASEVNRQLLNKFKDENYLSAELANLYSYDEEHAWEQIKRSIPLAAGDAVRGKQRGGSRLRPGWLRVSIAALLIIALGTGIFFKVQNDRENSLHRAAQMLKSVDDVLPGGNKALLTLADGKTLYLNGMQDRVLGGQGNSKISNLNGRIRYEHDSSKIQTPLYNKVSTPRGGQYEVILEDGSAVWLNAASSIRFPTNFQQKERRVEITGEAYFEVAEDRKAPFIVTVKGAEVVVTGTHFNVMSYDEEELLATTLFEGSVQFKKGENRVRLRPGQQSQLTSAGQLKVTNGADPEEVLAWKKGTFYFENADIELVMRQIARWYNVEVQFKNKKNTDLLHVDIPRNTRLSEVLHSLEMAGGLQFKVEGQKIIVL